MRHADLLSPFTRTSIQRIRDILASTKAPDSVSWDPRTQRYLYKGDGDRVAEINARKGIKPGQGDRPREAAVLLPLVNFRRADLPAFKGKGKQRATDEDIIPGILLQVRAGHMRMHAGEVSFPGGKRDPQDTSLYHTALRETSEELGISPDQVEYVGQLGPSELSLGGMLVHVFIGFVHSAQRYSSVRGGSETTAMEPLPLSTLRVSKDEVLSVLPLPFKCMIDGDSQAENTYERLSWHLFRGDWAYRTVAVGDLPVDGSNPAQVDGPHEGLEGQGQSLTTPGHTAYQDYHKPDRIILPDHSIGVKEHASPSQEKNSLDVWGLTGWFLNVFMWRMGFWGDVRDAGGKVLEVEQPGHSSRL